MKKLITLSFLPQASDLGLLVIRLWAGFGMFYIHGLDKLKNFSERVEQMGQGGIPNYLAYCAIAAESLGAVFFAVGFATRWAAAALATTMSVAFFKAHKAVLTGPGNGETAFIYLGFFAAILLAGAGRFSVDRAISK